MAREDFQPIISYAVELLKEKANLTQKFIAEALDISPSYLNKMLRQPGNAINKHNIVQGLKGILKDNNLEEEFHKYMLRNSPKSYTSEKTFIDNNNRNKYKYDIYLASPKLSIERKITRYDDLRKSISGILKNYLINEVPLDSIDNFHSLNEEIIGLIDNNTKPNDLKGRISIILKNYLINGINLSSTKNFASLNNEIRTLIEWSFFGTTGVKDPITEELKSFNNAVKKLYFNLKKQGYKVKFPRRKQSLKDVEFRYPPSIFSQDLKYLFESRTYLIVSPYPRIFSSAWVELGISLGLNKPVMIIARDFNEDIPYVISIPPRTRMIYHRIIHSLDAIPDQYLWIKELGPFREEEE